jgi:hypothetical protein
VQLKVSNFANWCTDIKVAGAAYTAPVCVPSTGAELTVEAATGFVLGMAPLPFVGATASAVTDTGTGPTATASYMVPGGTKCIIVCCPDSESGSDCQPPLTGCP